VDLEIEEEDIDKVEVRDQENKEYLCVTNSTI